MAVNERSIPELIKASFLNVLDVGAPRADAGGPEAPVLGLPVFVIGLRDLARGAVAPSAKQVGWQFLTSDKAGGTISGDVPDTGRGGDRRTASRLLGPAIENILAEYEKMKGYDQVRINDYEPRVLRIPGLRIEAFWIRHKPDYPTEDQLDLDYVVTFHTFHTELSEQTIVSMRQFLNMVQPLARQRLGSGIPRD